MRIGVIGRTEMLFNALHGLIAQGHDIVVVGTCKADPFYLAKESDYEAFARSINAPYFCDSNLSNPVIFDTLQRASCDIGLTMNWLNLITPDVIALFKHGVFNVHPGALPRYRGNACPNWAILNGEPSISVTIHQIDDGLDSGPIALQAIRAIDETTHIGEVYRWLRAEVPPLLIQLVAQAEQGVLRLKPQPASGSDVLRCYPRRPEDSRIDWRQSARDAHRLIRASSEPFAGAFTTLEGREALVVWGAEIFDPLFAFMAIPGQITMTHDGYPVVACGQGMLRLTDIELPATALRGDEANAIVSRSLRNRLV